MANGHSEEFRRDAVRIALTSGLTRRQVSADLTGIIHDAHASSQKLLFYVQVSPEARGCTRFAFI